MCNDRTDCSYNIEKVERERHFVKIVRKGVESRAGARKGMSEKEYECDLLH